MPPNRPLHEGLETLKGRVVRMGEDARAQLLDGVRSLMTLDEALARTVIQREDALNRLDVELERDLLDFLALKAPVARDLRTVGASLKILTYIDRIGKYGYDVAEATVALQGKGEVPRPRGLETMATRAAEMFTQALDAYRLGDTEEARKVRPKDDVVDGLNDEIFRTCVTYMMEDARAISACAHYILVARHLERVADNAVKIAEKTIYMTTGERRIKL
ncbi:MAG TPA: phosphate signaling complex protein PhoU [Candidatus Thermoplasmatota archaeon]|nr:phosphate signaling complex protein PhoU [Candidatus Thermoplasmatota archaeon]